MQIYESCEVQHTARIEPQRASSHPCEAIGFDQHNLLVTGGVAMTLLNARADGHSVPVVVKPKPAYLLKIRGGADTYIKADGSIGTAGKGPLIQTDISPTLGVTQDQYLFSPKRKRHD